MFVDFRSSGEPAPILMRGDATGKPRKGASVINSGRITAPVSGECKSQAAVAAVRLAFPVFSRSCRK